MNSARLNPYGRQGGPNARLNGGDGVGGLNRGGRSHNVGNDPRLPQYNAYGEGGGGSLPSFNGSQSLLQQQYMMNQISSTPNLNYSTTSFAGLPPAPSPQSYSQQSMSNQGSMQGPAGGGGRGAGLGSSGNRSNQKVSLGNPELAAKEQKCRALFVRNVKFDADTEHIRRLFEACGEVKTFFSMVENRGIVFVTFYDIRGADLAKNRIQGTLIENRPIDVHYSLPKDDEQEQRCDRDKNQGTLFVTLRHHPDAHRIQDDDYYNWFSQFGELLKIRTYKGHPDQRFVEFYDSRACVLAHDKSLDQPYLGGKWDCKFAWDNPTKGRIQGGPSRDLPKGSGIGGGMQNNRDSSRYDRGYAGQGQQGGAPPAPPYSYQNAPVPQQPQYNGGIDADARARLEQAQKVQQMLQSLSGGNPSAGVAQPPLAPPAPPPPASLYGQGYNNPTSNNGPALDYSMLQSLLSQSSRAQPQAPTQMQPQTSQPGGGAYQNYGSANPLYHQPPPSAIPSYSQPTSIPTSAPPPPTAPPTSAPPAPSNANQMQQLLALLSQQQKR